MAKASFRLPNGTSVLIEGTPEEVRELLAFYASTTHKVEPQTPKRPKPESENIVSTESKTKPDKTDIEKIVELVKTCPEAEVIEKHILDQTNEANRVLVPLYIIHEHLDNIFGLTTTEISEVTIALGVKVSRQNALRVLKFTAPGFVIKLGNPPRYKINRRGLAHIKSVIAGTETTASVAEPPKKKIAKGRKITKGNKGPQTLILELRNNDFFSEQRSIADVQKKLEELGHIFAQTSLSAPLIRLVRSQKLKRIKENDAWYYVSS